VTPDAQGACQVFDLDAAGISTQKCGSNIHFLHNAHTKALRAAFKLTLTLESPTQNAGLYGLSIFVTQLCPLADMINDFQGKKRAK